MDRSAIFETFTDVLMEVMDIDDVELDDNSTAEDVEEWDSLSNVRLIVAVERTFNVRFSNSEIEKFERVGDLIDSISKKMSSAVTE